MSVPSSALAHMIRSSAADLGKIASELGDKFFWSPLDKGRSAHSQLVEVSGINLYAKHIVETGAVPDPEWSMHEIKIEELDTPVKTVEYLTSAADLLATVVEVAPAERLATVITLPFGGGMTKTIAEVVMMAYWNTVYHEGQVNYIDTLK